MSGATVADFIAYWESEGEKYVRQGDYEWMASLVPGQRVLEIGCGVGFGTAALLGRGLSVLALDTLPACLETACVRSGLPLDQACCVDVQALLGDECPDILAKIEHFAPQTVVCWLMGAPAETTGANDQDAGQAVASYRERVHRAVAQLATRLPSVTHLHFVDRTAIPWQAKDIGRDTLVRYHLGKTLLDLPWGANRAQALYRRLGDKVVDIAQIRQSHPTLKSVVPTLASLLAERKN